MQRVGPHWTAPERYVFRHWVYSARELELMLRGAGFSSVELFGGLDGQPDQPDAARLVALATRG
jgi:hypothetical protein